MLKINERDHDERCAEEKQKNIIDAQTEFDEQREAQQPGDELHQRIPERDPGATVPAPSQEQKVADDRDVVVEWDSGSTLRATGRRADNRFTEGNAVNAHVEEASQN